MFSHSLLNHNAIQEICNLFAKWMTQAILNICTTWAILKFRFKMEETVFIKFRNRRKHASFTKNHLTSRTFHT